MQALVVPSRRALVRHSGARTPVSWRGRAGTRGFRRRRTSRSRRGATCWTYDSVPKKRRSSNDRSGRVAEPIGAIRGFRTCRHARRQCRAAVRTRSPGVPQLCSVSDVCSESYGPLSCRIGLAARRRLGMVGSLGQPSSRLLGGAGDMAMWLGRAGPSRATRAGRRAASAGPRSSRSRPR